MDKLKTYRSLVTTLLSERADLMRSQPLKGEEIVCLFQEESDNYLILRYGWLRGKRLHSITLHLRIANEKIYIEQDWTEGIAQEFLDAGIPYEDIVLAFNPPEMRQYTEFAVA